MDGGDGEVCAVAVVGGQGWGFVVVVPWIAGSRTAVLVPGRRCNV